MGGSSSAWCVASSSSYVDDDDEVMVQQQSVRPSPSDLQCAGGGRGGKERGRAGWGLWKVEQRERREGGAVP